MLHREKICILVHSIYPKCSKSTFSLVLINFAILLHYSANKRFCDTFTHKTSILLYKFCQNCPTLDMMMMSMMMPSTHIQTNSDFYNTTAYKITRHKLGKCVMRSCVITPTGPGKDVQIFCSKCFCVFKLSRIFSKCKRIVHNAKYNNKIIYNICHGNHGGNEKRNGLR